MATQFKATKDKTYEDPAGRTYTGTGGTSPAADWLASTFKETGGGLPGPNPSQMSPEARAGMAGYDAKGNRLSGYQFDTFGNVVGGGLPDRTTQDTDVNNIADQISALFSGDFATSNNGMEDMIKSQREKMRQKLEADRATSLQEGRDIGAKELGGLKGSLSEMTGGEMGFSSIETSLMNNQKKQNEARLTAIDKQYNEALLNNDELMIGQLSAERQAVVDNQTKISNALVNRINAATNLMSAQRADRAAAFGEDITTGQEARADKSLDWTFGQEGRTINAEDREIAKEETENVLALSIQYADAKINPDDSIAVALEKARPFMSEQQKLELEQLKLKVDKARNASGTNAVLSDDERFVMPYLDQQEDGTYAVDMDAILNAGFKTGKFEDTASKANDLADKLNAEARQKRDTTTSTDTTGGQDLGVWGTGATTRAGAAGEVIKEIPAVGQNVVGAINKWLFGEV